MTTKREKNPLKVPKVPRKCLGGCGKMVVRSPLTDIVVCGECKPYIGSIMDIRELQDDCGSASKKEDTHGNKLQAARERVS